MITKIKITDSSKLPIKHWPNVTDLKNRKIFNFKPGLNIVIGENGSGKSTLLQLLKDYFLVNTGYINSYNQEELLIIMNKNFDGYIIQSTKGDVLAMSDTNKDIKGFSIENIIEKIDSTTMSTGQSYLHKLGNLLNTYNTDTYEKFISNVNDFYKKSADEVRNRIISNRVEGEPKDTIILDEPFANLSILNELEMYNFFYNTLQHQAQLIIATNSIIPFMLNHKVNVINVSKGYDKIIRKEVQLLQTKNQRGKKC